MEEWPEGFFDSRQSREISQDIRSGDNLFNEYDAPVPQEELLESIKTRVGLEIQKAESSNLRAVFLRAIATAAILVIFSIIGTRLFNENAAKSRGYTAGLTMTGQIWESEDLAADDEQLVVLAAEIDELENELLAIRLGQTNGNGEDDLTELEIDVLQDTDSDFWKG